MDFLPDRSDNEHYANTEDAQPDAKIAAGQPTEWYWCGGIYTRAVIHEGGQVLYQNCNCNGCDPEFQDDYRNFSPHCRACRCVECVCPLRVRAGRYSETPVTARCGFCVNCSFVALR